jgi:hypothetical protein
MAQDGGALEQGKWLLLAGDKGAKMAEPIHEALLRSIPAAATCYHRLVLLVGPSGSGKTAVLQELAEQLPSKLINVNLELSRALLELTTSQRIVRLPRILDELLRSQASPLLLDNLEILFDHDLKHDPLRLLQALSRNRVVVASWNGSADAGALSYAEFGHPECRCYDSVDALIVGMDGRGTIDALKKS